MQAITPLRALALARGQQPGEDIDQEHGKEDYDRRAPPRCSL